MNVAIAVFVKTPGLSPLKTRLAATIGQEKAEDFYRLSLRSIANTLNKADVTPYWAVGEVEGLNDPLWDSFNGFNKLHTGNGDLGDRQNYIYNTLLESHDAVFLIGGDAPQLSHALINETIEKLTSNDFVIGPAHDGGYYLLAGTKPIEDKVWNDTPWSDDHTREILTSKLSSQPQLLKALTDVDIESDLELMLGEMPKNETDGLNEDQIILQEWIAKL